MRLTYKGSRVMVLDGVLEPADAASMWQWFQAQPLGVDAPGNGARRPVDGFVYAGSSTTIDASHPVGPLTDRTILAAAELAEYAVGVAGRDWTHASRTCWSYPAGTQLGWHNDGPATQTGAYVWYVHPRWGASWGGELLVVDDDASDMVRDALAAGLVSPGDTESWLSTDAESDVLFAGPDPLCFQARPNRIVLFASDTFHTVRRVDPSAGDRLRCSVAGFFLKSR
jgi:hypothetical protein